MRRSTSSFLVGAIMCGTSFVVLDPPRAHATATATAQSSFTNLAITPSAGSVVFLPDWSAETYAEATVNNQFNSGSGLQSASALGDYSSAQGSADASGLWGLAFATVGIPGQTVASDAATGRGALSGTFMITGGVGPVNTLFSVHLDGSLNVFTDVYGELAEAETVFSLEVDGSPTLFDTQLLSIGPSDSDSLSLSSDLSNTLMLQFDTPYFLYVEADAEVFASNVPEPGALALLTLAGGAVWLRRARIRRRFGSKRLNGAALAVIIVAAMLLAVGNAHALYIGSEAPDVCQTCGFEPTRESGGMAQTSLTEGNLREDYPVTTLKSESGPSVQLGLTYNSYNADSSHARVDCGLGFGWTHSYNAFLFKQRGHFFRMDGQGRVAQYRLGPGGTYTADTGYFETLTAQLDGSIIITNKQQSWWRFASVPNTPFQVGGPVYRLTEMGDRNQNVTTLAYSNGLLILITDTYGRSLSLGYTNNNKLAAITDPLGRITRFQYDAQYRLLTRATDADGKITRYTYNSLYQLTRKIDRDLRIYFYLYKKQKPYAVLDGLGQTIFSLSNPLKWDTDRNVLSALLRREYVPTTTTKTNGLGYAWRYSYDTNGYVTKVVAPDGATTTYSYDSATRLLASVTNANGAVTRYQYDSRGNRTNMADALGNITTYTYEPNFNQMTSLTDPNGRTTTYQYDERGNRTNETDNLGGVRSWAVDDTGIILGETDKMGRTTTYSYDTAGNRIGMTNALGNVTTYEYDGVGNQISQTDALGRTTEYTYDARDRMTGVTNALGGVTTYTYDALDRRISQTDPEGNTTSYDYDTRGRLAEIVDALGNSISSAYDANNNRTASTNQNGNVTEYAYDSRDRMVRTTNSLGGVTSRTYDSVGNRLSETDPLGRTTEYTYDALNRVIRTTNALGGVTQYDYASSGGPPCCSPTIGSSQFTRTEDANGKVTFYKYDALDRQVQIIRKNNDTNDVADGDDAVTTYAYDAVDNRIAATDPNGNVTTYAYDALNRLTNSVNPAGDTTSQTYDSVGNQITTTSPNGNITTSVYDSLNRRIASTDSGGLIATNGYDAGHNQIASTDALGHTTSYAYDSLDRRIATTDALGNSTSTLYDPVGNVIQTTDREGHVTSYTYDSLDRLVATTNALGHVSTSTYDAVGNRTAVTDANGNTTSYAYDALNRRIAVTYPDPVPNTVTYTYDAVGNQIGRTDQQGRVTTYGYNDLYFRTNRSYTPSGISENYTYDLSGRMLSASRAGWLVTYAYDAANRVISTTQNGVPVTRSYNIPGRTQTNTYPSGRVITETTDARGRLSTVHDGTPNPPIATYTYDAADRVITCTNRNGTYATYAYNSNNWVTSLEHSNGVTRIAGFGYTYDAEGNKRYEEKRHMTADSEAYEYDAVHRLTNFAAGTLSGFTIPSPTLLKAWTLDPLGNWNSVVSNSITELRTHNTANEITTINAAPIYHDDNGNIEQDTTYAYTYDEENRLTEVLRLSDTNVVGQYSYDALGRRVIKIANASGSPTTNVFLYDDARIIEEQDADGVTTATYTYGNYVDEVLTMDRAGQTYYYHWNVQWTPQALTDSGASIVERYTYDAYGCPTVMDASYTPLALNAWGTPHSAVTNAFLFTGRELDEEDGRFHFRARSYDCEKGRFLQRDPLGMVDSENLYLAAFVPNHLDPTGMQRVTACTSGGSTTCPINPGPNCTCSGFWTWTKTWSLSAGALGEPDIVINPTRTYTIENNDGTRARVTCDRLRAWRNRSSDHEDQHVKNCGDQIDRLNAAHVGVYPTVTECVRAKIKWENDWRAWWAIEVRHEHPESPRPTDCAAEFRDEMAAGWCRAPVPLP